MNDCYKPKEAIEINNVMYCRSKEKCPFKNTLESIWIEMYDKETGDKNLEQMFKCEYEVSKN